MTATVAVEDARQGALLGDARSGRASTAAEKEREETPTPTFQAGASALAEEAEAPREVADTAMSDKKRAESRADASAAMPPSPDSSSESAGLRQVVRGKRARRKTREAAAARAIETPAASPFTPRATAEPETGKSDTGGAVVAVESRRDGRGGGTRSERSGGLARRRAVEGVADRCSYRASGDKRRGGKGGRHVDESEGVAEASSLGKEAEEHQGSDSGGKEGGYGQGNGETKGHSEESCSKGRAIRGDARKSERQRQGPQR